jgi:hypothetical protein
MKLNVLSPYEVVSSPLIVPQLSAVIEIFDDDHQADSSVIFTVLAVVEPLATPVPHDGRLLIVGAVRSGVLLLNRRCIGPIRTGAPEGAPAGGALATGLMA